MINKEKSMNYFSFVDVIQELIRRSIFDRKFLSEYLLIDFPLSLELDRLDENERRKIITLVCT